MRGQTPARGRGVRAKLQQYLRDMDAWLQTKAHG